LPGFLSRGLAEDIEIMIGDGSIFRQTDKFGFKIRCSGDPAEEKSYYDDFVAPLKNNLFNTNLKAKFIYKKRRNEYGIDFNSQAIALFYIKIIGLPVGEKEAIVNIPDLILNSKKKYWISCIRGIFDTDGSLVFKRKEQDTHFYPVLKLTLASRKLSITIANLLQKLGFKFWAGFDLERYDKRFDKTHKENEINLSGVKNLKRWMEIVKFNNPKHMTKYLIWKNFGFYPPKLSFNDRLKILEGKIILSK